MMFGTKKGSQRDKTHCDIWAEASQVSVSVRRYDQNRMAHSMDNL